MDGDNRNAWEEDRSTNNVNFWRMGELIVGTWHMGLW